MDTPERKSGKKRSYAVAGRSGKGGGALNLYLDVRTGIYVWRRMDETTGRRFKRSTGTTNLDIALKTARDFEDEYQRKLAGLATYDCWRKELPPLVEEWINVQSDVGAKTLRSKKFRMLRALEALELRTAADLDHVARLQDRLLALERGGIPRVTLRRAYQDPLRQFAAWLAENNRHLNRNPLVNWKPLRLNVDRSEQARRAFLPDEVARAFLAADQLDVAYRRAHAQRPIFLALLITAPRVGALLSRDVSHLDRERERINFGKNVGKKRKGAGALDPSTFAELKRAIGDRTEGPLLLSPDGARATQERLLDSWREAFGLGVVDALWPKHEPRSFDVARLVNLALLRGRVQVSKGGNPKRVRKETVERLGDLERRVVRLVEELRSAWSGRMDGVDVHAFRMTHRTWAEAQGVPAVLIDLQLGHQDAGAEGAIKLMSMISGSATGRRHYLDVHNELFDASRSARAVRELLDDATARVQAAGSCFVPAPAQPASTGSAPGVREAAP